MHRSILWTLAAAASAAEAWDGGLNNPVTSSSAGRLAHCIQGNVAVTATSPNNVKLALPLPANETVVVQTVVDMLKAGSTFATDVNQGNNTVSGTYSINARYCYPANEQVGDTIQFLTHGIGFDKSYWDIAENYSYIDVAAANGYPTFSYDRLGVGLSDHPDPNQVVQAPLEVEIAHTLIQMLRSGYFASGRSFSKIVGVGHSFGSSITQSITYNYPSDVDAAVLTGFSTNITGLVSWETSLDLTIASENAPSRFGNLSSGYLVSNNIVGNQFAFFKAQGFPYSNLVLAEQTKQTVTFGEIITLPMITGVATGFTGPVDVVDGDSDWPFCMGNCTVPMNLAQAVLSSLYPAAGSGSEYYLACNSGHGINAHYSAGAAFDQIQAFVKNAGL